MQQLYLESNERALEDIAAALARGDDPTLLRLLHTMKSSSAQVGAVELAALARDCEHAMRQGHPPGPDWPMQLREAFGRLRAAWRPAAQGLAP
jgi:HPt (histidine-containing phosphotransfer) domain-containing protein